MNVPGNMRVAQCNLTLVLAEEFTFAVTENPAEGALYVSSVSDNTAVFNFNIVYGDVNLNESEYALTLKTTDRITWTGSFGRFGGKTIQELAGVLGGQTTKLAAGVLGIGAPARDILVNAGENDMMLVLCALDAEIYAVTYNVQGGNSFVWELAAGMTIPQPVPTLAEGMTFQGWYMDADHSTALAENTVVTGNTTLYAKVETTPVSGTFLEHLSTMDTVTIDSMDDWEIFAANSAVVPKGKLVQLGIDVDCNNKTYATLTFKGNFNGYCQGPEDAAARVHTIKNAKFTTVDSGYTASSETGISSCGLFNCIANGQKVANLNLDNITTQDYNATYSGPLAGLVDGYNTDRALVQNIQVTNCKSQGRSAGGVIGFIRNATIEFASSTGCNIQGLANGAGIVGIASSNAIVRNCYSTSKVSALSFMGGTAGGIAGKNLRGGRIQFCWTTNSAIEGKNESATTVNCLASVKASTPSTSFEAEDFSTTYWTFNGLATTFNADKIIFSDF